jgi:hypothetical protein
MTELQITLWGSGVGDAVGSIFALPGALITLWLTQHGERRQQVWQTEVGRIVDLEERAGQLVELIGSHQSIETIRDRAAEGMSRLASDAGRFRRHKRLMQAIRDLHNGLSTLLDDKGNGRDFRETGVEIDSLYESLLSECDKVTGPRRI